MDASWTCVRDLHWVAKRTCKFPHKYTRVTKNPFQGRHILYSLGNNRWMDVSQFALTWVGWPNGEKHALTCVQIWSRPKWAQVIPSARKNWPNIVASRYKFSTCVYLRLRLARALVYVLELPIFFVCLRECTVLRQAMWNILISFWACNCLAILLRHQDECLNENVFLKCF